MHGGFGGPSVKFGSVRGQNAIFAGGKGAWLINHSFAIGGGGYGMASRTSVPEEALKYYESQDSTITDLEMHFGYGGLMLEYVGMWDRMVHYTVSSLIGGGGVTYARTHEYGHNMNQYDIESDAFFVLEPGINLELNLTTFMRLDAGVYYRYVSGVDSDTMIGLTDSDLSDVNGTIILKFGKF